MSHGDKQHASISDECDDSSDLSPSVSPAHSMTRVSPGGGHASFAAAQLAARGRRTRTISESEKILSGPTLRGRVVSFCREKGHGFIEPNDGGENLFMHISDIEGDYVPAAGDIVSYKRCAVPPKKITFSAVHVNIIQRNEAIQHEKWIKESEQDTAETRPDY